MEEFVSIADHEKNSLQESFKLSQPFNHLVIDNFLNESIANKLVDEFPSLDSPLWYRYENAIEKKRAMNSWDRFPPATYQVFTFLNSPYFLRYLEDCTGISKLYPDVGLHGGGWHAHGPGGKLNVHLDYSIHPKLGLERKLNLILYLTPDWKSEWGGGLEFWAHDHENNGPKNRAKTIENVFNRAVLFDTTQNSWHGLPDPISCPQGQMRRSLAVYYLIEPEKDVSKRPKALFAPHKEQKNDQSVLDLIKLRASLNSAGHVYRDED